MVIGLYRGMGSGFPAWTATRITNLMFMSRNRPPQAYTLDRKSYLLSAEEGPLSRCRVHSSSIRGPGNFGCP